MGSTYLITGRKHTSTNLKVLAWAFFFFVLFDMVWVRRVRYGYAGYGIGMGMGMVYGFGSGWDKRYTTRDKDEIYTS